MWRHDSQGDLGMSAKILKKLTDFRLLRPMTFFEKHKNFSLYDRLWVETFLNRQPSGSWTKSVMIDNVPCDAFTISSPDGVSVDVPLRRTPMGICERSERFKKLAASTPGNQIECRMEINYELFGGSRPVHPAVINTILADEFFAFETKQGDQGRIARPNDPCPADDSVSCEYIDPIFGHYLFCRRNGCQNKKLRAEQTVKWLSK